MSFADVPTVEPDLIYQDTTVEFTIAIPDADPSVDTLTYTWINATAKKSITATDNGDGSFLVTLSAAVTDALAVGEWGWQAMLTTAAGKKYVVRQHIRPMVVRAQFGDEATYEYRHQVEQDIAAITVVLTGKASQDAQSYTIDERALAHWSHSDLRQHLAWLRTELTRLQNEEAQLQGRETTGKILYRFGSS